MKKSRRRVAAFISGAVAAVCLTAAVAALPASPAARAAASDAEMFERNENLVVRYDLDSITNNKFAATTWDSENNQYVANSAMDATITLAREGQSNGAVTSVKGAGGGNGAMFTKTAHARANFHLPSDATGMTISLWVKNSTAYWSSLVEFWDGTNGGRFGKGTMQGNNGRSNVNDPWAGNCPAHYFAKFPNGNAWDAFVTSVNSSDSGAATGKMMETDKWYQVIYTVTDTEMRAYRDGELMFTLDGSKWDNNGANGRVDPAPIIKSIMDSARNENGKLGIRLCLDGADGDILDDFRIYNGAMGQEEVASLFEEYQEQIRYLAMPKVRGEKLSFNDQTFYVNEFPASLTASAVTVQYPNDTEVADFNYNTSTHVATFKVCSKADTSEYASYTVRYKPREEGRIAYYSFDAAKSGSSGKVFEGRDWNGNVVSSLDMTARSGSENAAVTADRTAIAPTLVDVLGKGIQLPNWGYTTATLPAAATTEFTFSTWMNTTQKIWEAVVAIYDNAGTKGTIIEKGNMQVAGFSNGKPINGWEHLSNSTATWVNGHATDGETGDNVYFNNTEGKGFVFFTVTVSYKNGEGIMKFYKNGELAAVHTAENGGSLEKIKTIIEAVNSGAQVGLHRHHYDGGGVSVFDDASFYAYEMTEQEVKNSYNKYGDLFSLGGDYFVEGLSYPDLLLGGAESVSGTSTKTGVTANGVTYTYTPVTGTATKTKDETPVSVTLTRDGYTRTVQYKYLRRVSVQATSLGYKVGGTAYTVEAPAEPTDYATVRIAAADFNNITAGTTTLNKANGTTDADYTTEFAYDAATKRASISCYYNGYEEQKTVYTIRFIEKSASTAIEELTVTGVTGGNAVLTASDFTEDTAQVNVADLDNFSLTLNGTFALGASLTAGASLTQADLASEKLAFTVTAEDGTQKIYYLKPVVLDTDASLNTLGFGLGQLSPAFAADTLSYTLTLDKGKGAAAFAQLSAEPASQKASFNKLYNAETGKISIVVTAEDGTQREYSIALVERDTDATLAQILVGGNALAGFNPEVYAYSVRYKGELPNIAASATSAAADVEVGQLDAQNKITVTVRAENGTVKEYVLSLASMSADAAISELKINGNAVTLNNAAADYAAPSGVRWDNLAVEATLEEHASYVVETLENENKIKITVTAEDGTAAEYVVNVTFGAGGQIAGGGEVEDNSPASSGCNSSLGGAFGAIVGAAALALGLAVVCRKKKA